ncbi:MAG: hypothetical protein EOO27_26825, partial [Comamonadaceae bacterium]
MLFRSYFASALLLLSSAVLQGCGGHPGDAEASAPPVAPVVPDTPPVAPVVPGTPPVVPVDPGTPPVVPVDPGTPPVVPVGPGTPPVVPVGPGTPPVVPVDPGTPPVVPVDPGTPPVVPVDPGTPPVARVIKHPGAGLTLSDLQTLKANVDQGKEPWKSGFNNLANRPNARITYAGRGGPFAKVSRAPDENLNAWRSDMSAISDQSLMWYFTRDERYAKTAKWLLLRWANTHVEFSGRESMLDLGDYAAQFVGGAEILRSTYPGWTEADTATVKKYFKNVLMPAANPYGESMFGAANKGGLSLVALGLMAIYNDDIETLDRVVYQTRTLAHVGLRNSNDIGMLGDYLRDQGHAYGQLRSMAMLAEALWTQGIDIYSDFDNRLLAAGEYFARVNELVPTTALPFGTTDRYY